MLKNYSVESIIGIHGYSTPQVPGIGGKIKERWEDFIVREIPPSGHPIINGTEIGEDFGGMYIHCVLWKKGIDTFNAIKKLSKSWKKPEKDFGFAGLKDADAETFQRISIWNLDETNVGTPNLTNINTFHPIRQKFAIRIGDLLGNFFEIVIRNIQREWKEEDWNHFRIHLESKGILNFYGSQRFGSKRPILHVIGKLLLQEKYSEAIDKYIGETSPLEHESIVNLRKEFFETRSYGKLRLKFPKKYQIERKLLIGLERHRAAKDIIFSLPKPFLRLAISAYQAYLFNQVLSYINEINTNLQSETAIPLLGYQSVHQGVSEITWNKLLDLLEADAINLDSFNHSQPSLRSKGSLRRALVFPSKLDYSSIVNEEKGIRVCFSLPKGSYGTILLREIIKVDNT
ncbi:MAG: tRNA pseudouridine(13) synthase TruD [Candidatus Heimdallarchaeota archaeon]|nr:MAG: tRNA pseudouridine(13) synthase TruD [Candidatus Heimdallarchaeota archaeon]